MNHQIFSFFVLCSLVALSISGNFPLDAQAQDGATLTFSPSSYTATAVDETYTLDLTIVDVSNLKGWTADVTWNPEILELVGNPTEGDFLTSVASTAFLSDASESGGAINLASTLITLDSASGSGTLATLTFKIVAAAAHSPVNLVNTSIVSPEPGPTTGSYMPLPHNVLNPSATVSLTTGDGPLAHPGNPQTVNEEIPVTFNASQSTPLNEITQFSWTFDDDGLKELEGISPTYTFTKPGKYNVLLTVTNDQGLSSNSTVVITVNDTTPPVAIISLEVTSGTTLEVGQTVTFEAIESYDPENGTMKNDGYLWDLGDGSTYSDYELSSRFIHHSYDKSGTYTVSLMVTDYRAGLTDSTTLQVKVVAKESTSKSLTLPFEVVIILICVTVAVIVGSAFWLTGSSVTPKTFKP